MSPSQSNVPGGGGVVVVCARLFGFLVFDKNVAVHLFLPLNDAVVMVLPWYKGKIKPMPDNS